VNQKQIERSPIAGSLGAGDQPPRTVLGSWLGERHARDLQRADARFLLEARAADRRMRQGTAGEPVMTTARGVWTDHDRKGQSERVLPRFWFVIRRSLARSPSAGPTNSAVAQRPSAFRLASVHRNCRSSARSGRKKSLLSSPQTGRSSMTLRALTSFTAPRTQKSV